MHVKIVFTFAALLVLAVKGDPDPQRFTGSTPTPLFASPSALPDYDGKDVLVYLTPEQISALESGQGELEPVLEPQTQPEDEQNNTELYQIPQIDNNNDDELRKLIEQQRAYYESRPKSVITKNQKEKAPAPVKEPSQEESEEETAQDWYQKQGNKYFAPATERPENNKYYTATERPERNKNVAPASERLNRYYTTSEKPENIKYYSTASEKPEDLHHKSFNYYSVYNEKKGDNIDIKIFHPTTKDLEAKQLETQKDRQADRKYKLIPYDYLSKKLGLESVQEAAQRTRVSEKNTERQLGVALTPIEDEANTSEEENSNENGNEQNSEEEVAVPKYVFRYKDQKQDVDAKDLIKKAAEAKAKRPVAIRTKVTSKNVQAPKYVVRVPQPAKVKAPQSYTAPLEIVRHVPIDLDEIEKEEEEKPASYEVRRRVPTSKKVYVKVDKPYLVERIVPVNVRKNVQTKPQTLRILGPVWRHSN